MTATQKPPSGTDSLVLPSRVLTGIARGLVKATGKRPDLSAKPAKFTNDRLQERDQRVFGCLIGRINSWRDLAVQHRNEMLRMPFERDGQRFEGARVSSSLYSSLLDLANDRQRDAGSLGKFL